MVLTICRHSAATPLVGRPTPDLSRSLLSRVSRSCRAPLPSGSVPRGTERTHAAARSLCEGLCVLRTRPHALCVPRPFAFLSSAFHLSFSQPLWQAPSLISDDSMRPPARRVRVCASRAHALTPFASHVLSLSLFFSSAFHLSFSQPLWQAPSLISADSMRPPARRVRV